MDATTSAPPSEAGETKPSPGESGTGTGDVGSHSGQELSGWWGGGGGGSGLNE